MNKFLLFLLIISLSASLCFTDEAKELNPFQKYVSDPSYATFLQAVDFFQSNLEEDPQNDSNRIMLSYLYLMEIDNMLDQIDVYADSLSPGIQFNYANLLLELRKFDDAIEVYEMLNDKHPEWSCPWRHKGEALFKSGELKGAEVALKKAIETRQGHYDAYVMLAEVLEALGRDKEALATLETGFTHLGEDIEAPEEEVEDVDVQFLYLRLLQNNGKNAQAEKVKNSLKRSDPDDERWQEIQ